MCISTRPQRQEAVSSGCTGQGGGNWRTIANGCRVSVRADEKVLEVDSGDNGAAEYRNVASLRMHVL